MRTPTLAAGPRRALGAACLGLWALAAGCGGEADPGRPAEQAPASGAPGAGPAPAEVAPEDLVRYGAGPAPVDLFHPERARPFEFRRGGKLVVHLSNMPSSLNRMIENSADTRRMMDELHEGLVQRDWETWEERGVLAERWEVMDTLVHADGETREYGRVEEREDEFLVHPPADSPLEGPLSVPRGEVLRVDRDTVYTFHLRSDVRWHDGHPFDAGDVLFSFRCFENPFVDCDDQRFQFDKIDRAERLDDSTVRFFYERPYFLSLVVFDALVILPAHVYDLSDPDNPDHVPGASVTAERQGRYVNEHPGNQGWIGLGPYRVVERTSQYIEAERFPDYFDPERSGWVERIRWRHVPDDHAALQALLQGELDFLARVPSGDYFGQSTRSAAFQERFVKGYYFTPQMSYLVWNTARPKLSDARVRRALGLAFDWDEFARTFYRGLASRVTSERYDRSPGYDRELAPLPHDPQAARELLTEAGWYDRDGDGLVDREGEPLELEYLVIAGGAYSQSFGQKFQEDLAQIGVRLFFTTLDYPTVNQRVHAREFDCTSLAWVMPLESDPEQLWHSRWVGPGSSNHASYGDPDSDRLIEALQVEMDPELRADLARRLQRRIHDAQPYLFGLAVPHKFALSRRVRNFQAFAIDPGYSLRRWVLVE